MRKFIIAIITLQLLISCNEDENSVVIEVTTEDFETTIDENPIPMMELGNVTGSSNNGEVSFEIESQNPQGAFSIDIQSGLLTVLDATAFDFEINTTITGIVKVSNEDAFANSNILININDLEDSMLTVENLNVQIGENPEPNQSLGSIVATTDQGSLTYSIESQVPSGAFQINENTGEVSVLNETLFDFELNETISGIVKVSNGNIDAFATVTITLNDIEEIIVTTEDFEITIDENPQPNFLLGIIVGETNVGSVNFSLVTENPSGSFLIDTNNGELRVNDNSLFDFETNPTLSAIIEVENNGFIATSNITINLNDLNICGESQSITENLFYELDLNDDYGFVNTLDLVNHNYRFSMATDGQICSIGYQGTNELPYRIVILDSSNNIIYEDNLIFSTINQDYIEIVPIEINANEIYTINRFKENGSTADDIIGFGVMHFGEPFEFPITYESFTITETMVDDSDFFIPFITFGFTENWEVNFC